MPVALITGGSAGLGLALAGALAGRDWNLVIDARRAEPLRRAAQGLGPRVVAVPGDVSDPTHRTELVRAAERLGGIDLLVNNAGELGPSPLPPLADYPLEALEGVLRVNVLAPLALIQSSLPLLAPAATIINISSDAAVEAYPGWGGYGAAKAALDQVTAVLAVELATARPGLRVHAFDPGDLRTDTHQRAFPGEDISDRPEPATAVPALLRLIDERPAGGRYRVGDLRAAAGPAQPVNGTVGTTAGTTEVPA